MVLEEGREEVATSHFSPLKPRQHLHFCLLSGVSFPSINQRNKPTSAELNTSLLAGRAIKHLVFQLWIKISRFPPVLSFFKDACTLLVLSCHFKPYYTHPNRKRGLFPLRLFLKKMWIVPGAPCWKSLLRSSEEAREWDFWGRGGGVGGSSAFFTASSNDVLE